MEFQVILAADTSKLNPRALLSFRAFTPTDQERSAHMSAQKFFDRLVRLGRTKVEVVQPYWKIAEVYEIQLSVEMASTQEHAFAEVTRIFPVDWHEGDAFMIWSSDGNLDFASLPFSWVACDYIALAECFDRLPPAD